MDEELVEKVMEAARVSMGMDIAPVDLINIDMFATRVVSLADYRLQLQGYLKERMSSCAPSLSALIGEQVTAFHIKVGSVCLNTVLCNTIHH